MDDESERPDRSSSDPDSTEGIGRSGRGPEDPTEDRPAQSHSVDSRNPRRIGPYLIRQKLGEGGMGEVWQAQQEDPVRRIVALKVIKLGMDTRQVVARFESERQALALMNHPAIAKVFEAGSTPRGRPYFAMEFIPGEAITDYCDRHRLTTRDRLELFKQVCDGVQHAHHKGIIHRDLKPSNVLVMIQDDKPVPKIIDFGIAKATEQRLTERSVYTELGVLIGTPNYMSPEQAEMTLLDVDTRTDVYSLGVILYLLLVGALPFEPKELRKAGFDEIRRKIREEQPSKPSTRVRNLGDAATESARLRRVDATTLRRHLVGDLDWIIMKALEKDRTRRYGSPIELVADIERYLTDRPVLASPPSAVYRTRKFVRRHRAAVGVAGLLLGLLLTFAATMAVQAQRIARQRDRANLVSDFLTELFQVSDPGEARGNSITARELLDRGAERMEAELSDQPELQAELMHTMGVVYKNLGLYARAEPLLDRSLEIRRREFGDDHPETLRSLNNLGELLHFQGKMDEAEGYYREALVGRLRVLGKEHPETLQSIYNVAGFLMAQDKLEESEPYIREALAGRLRVLGNDHPDTLASISNLGYFLDVQGKFDEAEVHYRTALEGYRRVLGNDHPDTLSSINNVGFLLKAQGDLEGAEPYYRDALAGRRRVLGDDHPETLLSVNNMGSLLKEQGDLEGAEPYYREALEGKRRVLGDDHTSTLISMGNLGDLWVNMGRLAEAETLLAAAVEGARRALPDQHTTKGVVIRKYGACLAALERYDEAEAALLEAHGILTASSGAEHSLTRQATANLVELYAATGQPNKTAELE